MRMATWPEAQQRAACSRPVGRARAQQVGQEGYAAAARGLGRRQRRQLRVAEAKAFTHLHMHACI